MIRSIAKVAGGVLVAFLALALAAGAGAWYLTRQIGRAVAGPDPVSIATASLESMREQNRLTAFAARYVAVVTSSQSRFGLSARKTLILPGDVRYEIDLGRLRQRDLKWDGHVLSVTLPPIELAGPAVDLAAMREYDAGGVLMALTDAGQRIDASNRAAATRELLLQARSPVAMRLARDAARRAVERSFALPLVAAGLDARVVVRFGDEIDGGRPDMSRSLEEVYRNGGGAAGRVP